MEIRAMRPEERGAVLDLMQVAFGERDLFARYMDFDPAFSCDDYLLALDRGAPVAAVQVFEKTVRLRGRDVRLGGIGSVATAPAHRRKGLASELMRRSHERMRERGMSIGLLFSTWEFYGDLGWIRIPARTLVVHAPPEPVPPPAGVSSRAFEAADLRAVRDLYDAYSAGFEGTTIRDEAYWRGQLRYAGGDFHVAVRGGGVVAYARTVDLATRCAMEFAHAPGEEETLAALLLELAPPEGVLTLRLPPASALEGALSARAGRLDPVGDPTLMWRVLDSESLRTLAGLSEAVGDAEILDALITTPRAHYWLSDRF